MKKIWVHKARSFEDADRFDEQFWRRAGAAARFSATWLMVEEFFEAARKIPWSAQTTKIYSTRSTFTRKQS